MEISLEQLKTLLFEQRLACRDVYDDCEKEKFTPNVIRRNIMDAELPKDFKILKKYNVK